MSDERPWKVKHAGEEFTATSLDKLIEWVGNRAVEPTDYVYNPILDKWIYARDVGELEGAFAALADAGKPAPPSQANAKLNKSNRKGCLVLVLLFVAFAIWVSTLESPPPRTSTLSEPAPSTAAADAQCRQDLQCWGDKHLAAAGVYCQDRIERLAKNDFEWTDGFFEPKFGRFKWIDQSAGTLTYIGDKIKYQNGFGAWIFHTYQCDFNPANNRVIDARAEPGRLPR